MMEIETCIPQHLPLKNLDWGSLIPLIGEAREWVARFDEHLKTDDSVIPYPQSTPLNLKFLCHLHTIAKKEDPTAREVGRFRTRQNWIGPIGCKIEDAYFYPPKPQQVKKYMLELFRYMRQKEKDPLVQLAIFFAQLLVIHPFMDGNGRVARLFVPMWLWKKGLICKPGLTLDEYLKKNRLKYFQKLFNISEKKDWEDWIEFF